MATIRKRSEYSWEAQIRRKGFPSQQKTFNYRRDAEEWARKIEAELDRGLFLPRQEAERTVLADLIARYEAEVLPTKRGRHFGPTLRTLNEAFGKYALAAITSKMVADFRDKRLKAGLSPSTVRKEINLLSKLIDLAGKEWGVPLPANPCAMVSRPAERNARERRLAPGEGGKLVAEAETHVALLVSIAIETAARLGELLALRWEDVDLKRRVMLVRGVPHETGQRTKNEDPFRAIPLSSTAVATLGDLRKMAGNVSAINGRVFHWWAAADSFNKTWTRTCARAEIEDLRFHDLRHEAASRLFERGTLEAMEVASITGHKTLSMLKRYTHLRAEDLAHKLG